MFGNRGMKFLNEKWLSMNKEVAYRKMLRCSNKDQVRNLGTYVDKIKHKSFNRIKVNVHRVKIVINDNIIEQVTDF